MMDNKEKASIELHETIAALRVEIERHKLYDLTAAVLAKDMETTEERDQWRSMAERLAEALEYMLEGGGDNHVSESALAEFEKLKAQQQ